MTPIWMITGSSRGIGRAVAEAVLAAGHSLMATARDPDTLDDLVSRYGDRIRTARLDVTDPQQVDAAVQETVRAFGRIDVVANIAGYGNIGSIEDTSLEDIRAQIETNLFGTINVTKAVLPVMRTQRAGHIIQFSSVGGRIGSTGRAAYSAAKWGVEGFSEVLATETAPLGIKVTIIEPGGFRTDFAGTTSKMHAGRPEYDATVGAAERFQRDYDGKQPGDPAKAAAVIVAVAALAQPPLRLLLGSDAVRIVEQADLAKAAADLQWRHLSVSTDYAAVT
jgi:NAD(P)-dependent dehydrogenase (short-subunit alcohol dehydrogenase family)